MSFYKYQRSVHEDITISGIDILKLKLKQSLGFFENIKIINELYHYNHKDVLVEIVFCFDLIESENFFIINL